MDKVATEIGLEITKRESENYEMTQEGDCYSLIILNPKVEHTGRYTLVVKMQEKDSKTTSAYLRVLG